MFFQRKKNHLKRLWGLRVNTTSIASSSLEDQQSFQQQQQQQQQQHQLVYGRRCTANIINVNTTSTSTTGGQESSSFMNCCIRGNSSGSSSSSSNSSINGNSTYDPENQYALFSALAKKLKEPQIQTMCQAVEKDAFDGLLTHCVLVPRGQIDGEEPHLIACRIWRWPDLQSPKELKRIPSCPNEMDPVYTCCNPSHWNRLSQPDTPPPPYRSFAMDRLKPEDRAPSEIRHVGGRLPESLTTDGEEDSPPSGWCQLAYWELSQRVGRLFPVENPAVNIFSEQPRGDGLCLSTLALQRPSATPDAVLKARQKIGLGVTLSREKDGVWLYNRSAAPVFVHSPTLCDLDTRSLLVYRVPPGHCLRAFDHVRAAHESFRWPSYINGAQTGPVDIYSVRISFAKGWGPKYQRQEVTACPCWLEVYLSPCR